jgi:hypothetical protein
MAEGQPNVLYSIAELPGYSSSARAARREYHDVQLRGPPGRSAPPTCRADGSRLANDRVTTARLTTMRRRLNELEHTSENSSDEAEVMAAEEEAREIMDSLENVRDLRPSENG